MSNSPNDRKADEYADRLAELSDRVTDLRHGITECAWIGRIRISVDDVDRALGKTRLCLAYDRGVRCCLETILNIASWGTSPEVVITLLAQVAAIETIIEEEAGVKA